MASRTGDEQWRQSRKGGSRREGTPRREGDGRGSSTEHQRLRWRHAEKFWRRRCHRHSASYPGWFAGWGEGIGASSFGLVRAVGTLPFPATEPKAAERIEHMEPAEESHCATVGSWSLILVLRLSMFGRLADAEKAAAVAMATAARLQAEVAEASAALAKTQAELASSQVCRASCDVAFYLLEVASHAPTVLPRHAEALTAVPSASSGGRLS